jgi:hypothetical protein
MRKDYGVSREGCVAIYNVAQAATFPRGAITGRPRTGVQELAHENFQTVI